MGISLNILPLYKNNYKKVKFLLAQIGQNCAQRFWYNLFTIARLPVCDFCKHSIENMAKYLETGGFIVYENLLFLLIGFKLTF